MKLFPLPKHKKGSIEYYNWLWLACIATLPLDLLLIPYLSQQLGGALSLLSEDLFLWLIIIGALLQLTPLAKEPLIKFLLATQGVQSDAVALKTQAQFLFSALIALVVVIDIASEMWSTSPYLSIGIVVFALIALPTWYRSMKKQRHKNQEEVKPDAFNSLEVKLLVSTLQMELLLTLLIIIPRLGFPIALLGVHILSAGTLAVWCCLASALLSMLAMMPRREDLYATCRTCGLISKRAHQIDGYCPGCSELSLKSHRVKKDRGNHFEGLQELILRADKALERAKIPKIRQ